MKNISEPTQKLLENAITHCYQNLLSHEKGILSDPIIFFPVTNGNHMGTFLPSIY